MNSDWQDFLAAQSPTPITDKARLVALTDRSSLHVIGAEAGELLQAMLTQEILTLDGSKAARAAFCNAKGRAYVTLSVHPLEPQIEQGYALTLPNNLVQETLKLLKLYILRRKATLTERDDWVQAGLIGQPGQDVAAVLPDAPLAQAWHQPAGSESPVLITREDRGETTAPRYSLQGSVPAVKAMWTLLSADSQVSIGSLDEWHLQEIEDGLPSIAPETWGHFVPQWINLDLLSSVSFKKGCYPGQEVVARMHYLGKPNRRMLTAHLDCGKDIAPGTPVMLPDGETSVGEVVRSARTANGEQCNLLAVIKLGHLNESLRIDSEPMILHQHAFAPATPAEAH